MAAVVYPKFYVMTRVETILRILTALPTLINVVIITESYARKNFKLVPIMLQLVMIRKELQFLSKIDNFNDNNLARTQ